VENSVILLPRHRRNLLQPIHLGDLWAGPLWLLRLETYGGSVAKTGRFVVKADRLAQFHYYWGPL
jgi:hypothetical protein